MLSKIWTWILNKIFHVSTETKPKEVEDNTKYAVEYERIDNINFTSIFANKLANYTISDSNMNITGKEKITKKDGKEIKEKTTNPRTELLSKIGTSMWKKAKKITSMSFGYGGVFLVPYVKGNKLYYNLVPQSRVTIDATEGDLITGATILAERKEITTGIGQTKTYIRWTNYRLENGNCIIEQKFSDETGAELKETPIFWKNILLKQTISGVDRVLLGYIKSPINNRKVNDKYGVPICYGCEATILEIKQTMKQIVREYELKECFVGVDVTMFKTDKNGKVNRLPDNGLYKLFNFDDKDNKFNVYDPQYRDYTTRLQELYKRLEHEVGTSYGILSEVTSVNATATEIKHAMYDTFTLCDDARANIEKGMEDFFYACNVLANAYKLSTNGEYELGFDWSYSLLEDTQSEWSQLTYAQNKGIISKVELRQWLKPNETFEESEKAIQEIEESEPTPDDILGNNKKGDEE